MPRHVRLAEEPASVEIRYTARDVVDSEDVPDDEDVLDHQKNHHRRRAAGSGAANGEADSDTYNGPVDLDELFTNLEAQRAADDGSLLFSDQEEDDEDETQRRAGADQKYFNNPHKRLLDNDASLIPGSPFSKPPNRRSNRPSEPLSIAKYASNCAFLVTIGWVVFLLMVPFWYYTSVGRIIVEMILALLSFFGLFWNSYFVTAMIFKCFIPKRAFLSNTKYCSIIPETKSENSQWLDVTIQIPVYKESLHEVLMPTLKSCIAARDYYRAKSGARCNIVVCDDGMMAFLRDNFPAAEMLWKSIQDSKGRVVRLSTLLQHVPRASRRHLKGLRSRNVYEVFHRMLYFYHFDIGFVARSTVDRRGKFKKASNLNSHLRLALGAQQRASESDGHSLTVDQALLEESHNDDGSRYVMFGNDVLMGHLICVNDADARMAKSVILKTVPEFLNDRTLGFTQHATKTMVDQRKESYFTRMLAVYTDALYMGHFLMSSILGCHPPLVGHSIFLRTEAVNQCGRMRTLRKAQRWLQNIGLQFLPVDQVGFGNLQAQNRTEYWSENHVSEDFELMIHLYNLGFNGRYCAYPDCEFQEGITRTFDEEAGRHRKFALGAHELVFNPFQDMLGHGIFTPLFKTFLSSDIPSYYKVFLTAYLCSYTSGGAYIIVFTASALVRIFDEGDAVDSLYAFSPAGIIILNFIIYYVIGYITFLVSLLRMHFINNKLLFPEYRKKYFGSLYIVWSMLRYCLVFQFLFYNVATFTFYFLGSMDHLMAKPGIVGATNKDSINIGRCVALWDTIQFNSGSWLIAFVLAALAYCTMLQEYSWDIFQYPTEGDEIVQHAVFAGPPAFLALLAVIVPLLLNPWILGWPCLRKPRKLKEQPTLPRRRTIKELNKEIQRTHNKPDVVLGSFRTKNAFSVATQPITNAFDQRGLDAQALAQQKQDKERRRRQEAMFTLPGHSGGVRDRGRPSRDNSLTRGRQSRDSSLVRGRQSRDNSLTRGPPGDVRGYPDLAQQKQHYEDRLHQETTRRKPKGGGNSHGRHSRDNSLTSFGEC